jgi:hypothetical protein
MHSLVCDAAPGDHGWVWFDGQWCLARILDVEDEGDYIVIITDDVPEWISLHDNSDPVAMAPWIPISGPPYDGDDTPATHAVTWQGGGLTWIKSWSMNDEQAAAISRSVFAHLDGLLAKEAQG